MFKGKNNLCPHYMYVINLFKRQLNLSNFNLRNADFVIPRFKTVTYGKHSVLYLGPKLWVRLPNHIKSFSLKNFRITLRKGI